MNIPKKAFLTLALLGIFVTGPSLWAATPEESLRKSFPNIQAESVTPTALPGVYEIVSGGRVAYYAPGQEYLIVGEIITREGKNLTQERAGELLARKLKDVPLEKALKIGSGPHTVIEFTDPDCPYCRKAAEYLATRKDLTRYIFLYPLAMHPKAEAKIRQVFCSEDRPRAYEEAMAGKLDEMKFKPCDNPAAAELTKFHKEMGDRIGISGIGTPLFLIDGQIVNGANMPLMEKILGPGKN